MTTTQGNSPSPDNTSLLSGSAGAGPGWFDRTIAKIEGDQRLDQAATVLDGPAEAVSQGPRGAFLRGEWLGHALHPLLTDFPLGCWLSAGLLDMVGGRRSRRAAQRLIGIGLLTVPPTAAAGLAEFRSATDPAVRRVGAVHAVGNGAVAVMYAKSWLSRRKGHHLRGMVWSMAGGTLAWGTGYLGGHLSFGRGMGVGERKPSNSMYSSDNAGESADRVFVDITETVVYTPQA